MMKVKINEFGIVSESGTIEIELTGSYKFSLYFLMWEYEVKYSPSLPLSRIFSLKKLH